MPKTNNLKSYAKRVIDLTDIGIELGFYRNPCGNFSLIHLDNGNWLCHMRIFQYWIDGDRQGYWTNDTMQLNEPDKHQFVILDKDFNYVKKLENTISTYYADPQFNEQKPYLEDGRLVRWDNGIYLSSAIFYQNHEKYERFGLEIQKIILNGENVEAEHLWNSCEEGVLGRQKNWMPIPDKPFKYIAETYENGVVAMDISTGDMTQGGDLSGELYRGNTPLVETDFGYMTITHRLGMDERGRKVYMNYIVEYNKDLSVRRISNPFKLSDYNIEFVTTLDRFPDGELAIGVTVMDDTPLVMIYDELEFKEIVNM